MADEIEAADASVEVSPGVGVNGSDAGGLGPADPEAAARALRDAAAEQGYGAEQIKVLEGLEAVRKRPGMYIGGTGVNALHHLVYETVDNSIDEAMAGFATTVSVAVEADGSCRVTDDGRGIPVDPVRHDDPTLDGKPAVEIVMTKLHAGGKFQQEGSAYKVSGGLHGVGVSCVNALSEYLECEVWRDGKVHRIRFERGVVTEPLGVVGPVPANSGRRRGTTVTFKPDPTIFPDVNFDSTTLSNRLRELSFLNPGVTIRLTDERVGTDGKPKAETFRAEHGLKEFVQHLMRGKTALSELVHIERTDESENMVCEVAFQYHDGYSETLLSFANNINNVDGGMHAEGFKKALTRTLNGYARKAGIIKEKDPTPTGEDLREGLMCVVSVKLPEPLFNNQPKEKLLNAEVETFVGQAVSEALGSWLEEHPGEARRLCQKGVVAAQAREAAKRARELTRRKTALDSGSMPHKLKDCKTKDLGRSEMFIVEGDSAGGSATQGRDVETQAILPLRGKLLNVERARIDKVLAFEEIRTLISALRCGIGADFDVSKLRYGKIIIMTDADVDGSHIRTLLLTFFFRQMPELIRRGHVYIAQPPLYQITKNRKSRYVVTKHDLDDVLTDLGLEDSKLLVRDVSGFDPESAVNAEPPVVRELIDGDARRGVHLLRRLADLVEIAERRGTRFVDLLEARRDGVLPAYKVTAGSESVYAWTEAEAHEVVDARGWSLIDSEAAAEPAGDPAGASEHERADSADDHGMDAAQTEGDGGTDADTQNEADRVDNRPTAVVRELHENRELGKIIDELAGLGIDIDDYGLVREESVTGERLPSRYAWATTRGAGAAAAGAGAAEDAGDGENEPGSASGSDTGAAVGRLVEAHNVPSIIEALHTIGRRGMEVKRFKGLGEMDAEQLWETTMDASVRTLMRVQWEQASDADELFSILMGEHVEPRRKYIEDHALEVKNLDV